MDDLTRDVRPEAPGASRPAARRPRRWPRFIIGGLVLLGLAAGGARYWLNARRFETTDDAEIDAYTTQISSRVAGQVTQLLFADNQHVEAGQTLLLIDPRDYQDRLDQVRGQQASAEATLEQARAQVSVQQAAVNQAAANVRVAEADLVLARQDYERYQRINPGAVTRQQIKSATATFHSDEAKVAASRQTVEGAQAQVRAAQAQVLAAEASLKQAEANTRAAELQLSWCNIVAPVTGMVTHRSVSAGNYVSPGQALVALVQDGRWVTANFKETQLASIRPGQAVEVTVNAVPSVVFRGQSGQLPGRHRHRVQRAAV